MRMSKPGYKPTALGWIPEDWEVKRLEHIAEIQQGISKGKVIAEEHAITVPYMRVANVKDGEVDLTEIKSLTIHKAELKKYTLAKGDILITEGGDPDKLGRGGMWEGKVGDCVFQNHLFRIRTNEKLLSPSFLYSHFLGYTAKTYFLSCAKQTTGIASINSSQVRATPIPLPPLPEQRKIAAVLSTWDRAIAAERALIAALQSRHRALMQRLLSGKVRLKGFAKKWEEVRLGEVFNGLRGQELSKQKLSQHGAYKCILYGELFTTYREIIMEIRSRTDFLEGVPSVFGDILLPGSTTTTGIDLAKASALLVDDVLLGGDINILRPKHTGINAPFIANSLTHFYQDEILPLTKGITIVHLQVKDLLSIKISLPPLAEQHAIAEILTTSEREIAAHKMLLAALQSQKKGLMQVLLTGKLRVKV